MTRFSKIGLLLLPLLLLGGCSAKPITLIKTETVLLAPPAALLADCPETPIPASGSNSDLLELAKMLRIDLSECNRKQERLREWVENERRMLP